MRRLLLFAPFLLAGCAALRPDADAEDATGCRHVFESVYLAVTDAQGAPSPGTTISATNLRTGETYGPCPEGGAAASVLPAGCQADPLIGLFDPPDRAYYKVVGDEHRSSLSARGDTLLVRGTRGDRAFETRQVVRDDGCHVKKVWGLDEVRLR